MNDEHDFVADSEEEDSMELGMEKDAMDWQEGISTFGHRNVEEDQRKVQQMSSISDFTAPVEGGATSTTISAFTTPSLTKPRPRPRPIKKKTAAAADDSLLNTVMPSRPTEPEQSMSRQATNGTTDSGGELLDFTATSSIADRAKTRQRKQSGLSTAQQWDDDELISPNSKQKAKALAEPDYMQDELPRKAKMAKGKGKASKADHVLEISSDDDGDEELFLKGSSTKRKPISSPRTSSSLQPTELIIQPSRPRPRPIKKKSKGATEGETSNPNSANRTSTPGNPPPEADHVSSHPRGRQNLISSLPPSDPPLPSAEISGHSAHLPAIETLPQPLSSSGRKTPVEFDELFSGDDDLFGPAPVARSRDPAKLPPPPTFFAGSSSQINPSGVQAPAVQEGGVLDLTTLPTQNPEKDPKPKAKRKKKVVGEDEDDGDWGAVSSKTKEKKTSKKKKAMPQVEVVITTKPSGTDKEEKGKKKRKGGETGGSSRKVEKSKEVFKSREIIEDSDEDPLLESYRPEEASAALLSPQGGASSKDKALNDGLAPKCRSTELIAPPEGDKHMAEDDGAPVAQKNGRRKRKSMVVDDEEAFHEGPSRVEQSSNKRQKKEKQTRRGDDSEGVPANPAMLSSRKQKGKAKAAVIVLEDDDEPPAPKPASLTRMEEVIEPDLPKENLEPSESLPHDPGSSRSKPAEESPPKPPTEKSRKPRHSIGSRGKGTPMSELIKRVNSMPNSPFPVATSSRIPTISRIATSYSPYLKSSRSMLSKIAPLHPNRRTPPPPLPPPPPRKKTKKELEREEKWEEELIESLGGLEAWIALSDVERRDMRKAKFDMEMGGWDD